MRKGKYAKSKGRNFLYNLRQKKIEEKDLNVEYFWSKSADLLMQM